MADDNFKYNGIQINYKESGLVVFIFKKNSKFKVDDLLNATNNYFIKLFGSCESEFIPIFGGFTDIIAKTNNQEILLSWSNCYIYQNTKKK